jgi:serine-type D-Ala-D-Ala carboxypeptidase
VKHFRSTVAVLCGVVVGTACGDAGTTDHDARLALADSIVAAWTGDQRVAGAVLHVSVAGRPRLERAYGAAQLYAYGDGQYPAGGYDGDAGAAAMGIVPLATPRRMTTETVFDLASVTKVMATTLALMLLVDRGELEVDATVASYLPDFTGGGREAITLRHLLTHRSGLPQWWPVYYRAGTADSAYAVVRDLPLSWPVGEARHYSDLGFMVLGRVVEHVSGRPLDRFVREELYAPLGLSRTGFRRAEADSDATAPSAGITEAGGALDAIAATSHGNPFERRMVHDPDFGYRIDIDPATWEGWRRRTLVGEVNDGNAYHAFGGVSGHAGLFSTAAELDVLLRLMLAEGVHEGRRLFGPDVVDRFLASTGDDQALGWELPAHAPPGAFGHEGFTGTFVLGVPEQALAVVLLTNRQNVGVDRETTYPDVGPLQRAVTAALTTPR